MVAVVSTRGVRFEVAMMTKRKKSAT